MSTITEAQRAFCVAYRGTSDLPDDFILRTWAGDAHRWCTAWDASRAALAAQTPAPVQAAGFDLRTSEGGRGYLARYFSDRLKRHDFRDYILEELAADFACALSGHLASQGAAPAEATPEQLDALDELVTMVRRLARALSRAAPSNALVDSAVDYLQRKGFNKGPFRSASGFDADFPEGAAPTGAGDAEPVGEVILFASDRDLKEVSWAKGKMPAPGTKLYDAPQQPAETSELLHGWLRYEKVRKLSPRAFAGLHARNLAGEHFDGLIDALPEPSTPQPAPATDHSSAVAVAGEIDAAWRKLEDGASPEGAAR